MVQPKYFTFSFEPSGCLFQRHIDEDGAVLDEYNIIHGSTTIILAVINSTQFKYKQVPALSDICTLASEE